MQGKRYHNLPCIPSLVRRGILVVSFFYTYAKVSFTRGRKATSPNPFFRREGSMASGFLFKKGNVIIFFFS